MDSRFHTFDNHRVHSIRFGSGKELLIAFHGYADRARLFGPLAYVLSPHFTVIAFDLPFHGQTEWQHTDFTKNDMCRLIRLYMQEEGVERVSFLGYSFGARIVQALLPEVIYFTNRLILLAPDGIATKGMAAAIMTPMWVRKLCYRLLHNPNWFIGGMNGLKRLGLVSPYIVLFMEKNLVTPERYQRTFGMWFALDHFWLRRREVNQLLNKHKTPVDIFFGRKDAFVKYKKVKKLAEKVPQIKLHLLDSGHRIIGADLAERLRANYELGITTFRG
jgi:pimeloyl-ACP methyl ester carboxylesterase